MYKKLVGIVIMTLLITTALPAVGTINKINNAAPSSTQNSGVEWSQKYGEDEYDVFYDVDVTTDGGYIVCGNREENGNYHPYVLKVDSEGNQQWNWTIREFEYNGSLYEIYDNWNSAIMQTSDGGYLTCLYINIEVEGEGLLIGGLVKFDASGNPLWFSYIGEEGVWWFYPTEIIEPEDKNIYVVSGTGATINDPINDHSAMLVITDLSGAIQDYAFYDYGDYQDEGYALCEANGGYLLTGTVWNTLSDGDYRMIKTDSNLDVVKSSTYGRMTNDVSYNQDCFQTADDGFIMGGQSYEFGVIMDAWVVRTDSDCNMLWNRSYGDTFTDTCWSMAMTDDDKYVLCVTMNFNGYTGDKEDTHLVKLDDNGKIEWIQINGGPYREVGISIKQTDDGGFIVAGRDGTSYSKDADATLVKFAPFDNEQPDKPDKPSGKKRIKLGEEYTYSSSTIDSDGDQVYYKWDWGDGNYTEWLGPYNSGDTCEATHNWSEGGDLQIKVMAKDTNGGESEWSDPLSFTPRSRAILNTLLLRFLERFPILRQLLGFL